MFFRWKAWIPRYFGLLVSELQECIQPAWVKAVVSPFLRNTSRRMQTHKAHSQHVMRWPGRSVGHRRQKHWNPKHLFLTKCVTSRAGLPHLALAWHPEHLLLGFPAGGLFWTRWPSQGFKNQNQRTVWVSVFASGLSSLLLWFTFIIPTDVDTVTCRVLF